MKPVAVRIEDEAARAVRRGRLWVYREALLGAPRAGMGGCVALMDARGAVVAHGLYDAEAEVAVRVLGRADAPVFELSSWLRRRFEGARALRENVLSLDTLETYRAFNGEGDGLSGLAVDVYGDYAVLELTCPVWSPHRALIVEAVQASLRPGGGAFAGVLEKSRLRPGPGQEVTEHLHGEVPPDELWVREGPARYAVTLNGTSKSGLFIDQRETREALRRLAQDKQSALNAFCYTGSLSVALAQGGAARVTSMDLSRPALERARRNFEGNALEPARHELAQGDAFALLAAFADAGRRFDVIMIDPPAFAQSKKTDSKRRTFQAERDYSELIAKAARLLSTRGVLVASSPMAAMPMNTFEWAMADGAAHAGVRLHVFDARTQPADHPVDPAMPEKRYLKVLYAVRADD